MKRSRPSLAISFFEHIGGDRPAVDPPERVYGWVDSSSEGAEDGYTRLDCIDANWADAVGFAPLTDPAVGEESESRVSMIYWGRETTDEQEGRIVELTLGDGSSGDRESAALHFLNLTGAPLEREVVEMRWPARDEAKLIASSTDIGGEDAGEEELREVLRDVPGADAVGVLDVGQGSCGSLIAGGLPRLYFDMGGGALRDARTFPAGFSAICTSAMPPVVLSHWHYDHWSLAKRFGGEILRSTWIVPRQPGLGPSSATLLGLIRSHGRALVRAPGEPTMHERGISIHDCAGKTLNDSGIAMLVWGPDERVIGLPGDARYRYIADLPDAVDSLVAAHHGGNTRAMSGEIPMPTGNPAGRLIFSCGPSNSYGHPLQAPVKEHVDAGWAPSRQLSTGDRQPAGAPEHVHLYWDASQADTRLACAGRNCSLAPCRR